MRAIFVAGRPTEWNLDISELAAWSHGPVSLEAEIEHSRTHAAHLLQAVLKEAFAPAA